MANSYFQFKQFTVHQEHCAMKVTTDGCLFGAWAAIEYQNESRMEKPGLVTTLDIGTGTGLLSLMLAQKINAVIDAIEIDAGAYQQASENFSTSPWHGKINPIHGDARVFDFTKQYDIIISNPPFYENELRSASSIKNRAHHDESLLLEELLAITQQYLAPAGRFFLLLPFKRNKEIERFFEKARLSLSHKTLVRQSIKHDPFRMMISGAHQAKEKNEIITGEIVIKDESNQYTPEFTGYLMDYYLHL